MEDKAPHRYYRLSSRRLEIRGKIPLDPGHVDSPSVSACFPSHHDDLMSVANCFKRKENSFGSLRWQVLGPQYQ